MYSCKNVTYWSLLLTLMRIFGLLSFHVFCWRSLALNCSFRSVKTLQLHRSVHPPTLLHLCPKELAPKKSSGLYPEVLNMTVIQSQGDLPGHHAPQIVKMDTQLKEKGILQVAYVLICKAIYRLAENNSFYLQMEEFSDKNKTLLGFEMLYKGL